MTGCRPTGVVRSGKIQNSSARKNVILGSSKCAGAVYLSILTVVEDVVETALIVLNVLLYVIALHIKHKDQHLGRMSDLSP